MAEPAEVVRDEMLGRPRPFLRGLALTVVTLGIYGLYWHWRVHHEVQRQLGRRRRDTALWVGLLVVIVVAALVESVIAGMRDRQAQELLALAFLGFTLLLQAWFLVYVVRQFDEIDALADAFGAGSQGMFVTVGLFASSFVLSWIGGTFLLFAPVLALIGYGILQEAYNDAWRATAARVLPYADEPVDAEVERVTQAA